MGIVISFEGLPGVGKTSAVNHVYEHLIQKGFRVAKLSDLHSYEGDRVGNKVFKLMKYNNDDFCRLDDPFHEAFLSQAIRYSLVNETILKANDQYDVVLEDRGIDTMFSYMLARLRQVYKLSFGQINEWLQVLNEPLGCFPDQTIYLHDRIENCRARHLLRNRGETHPFSDLISFFSLKCKKRICF